MNKEIKEIISLNEIQTNVNSTTIKNAAYYRYSEYKDNIHVVFYKNHSSNNSTKNGTPVVVQELDFAYLNSIKKEWTTFHENYCNELLDPNTLLTLPDTIAIYNSFACDFFSSYKNGKLIRQNESFYWLS